MEGNNITLTVTPSQKEVLAAIKAVDKAKANVLKACESLATANLALEATQKASLDILRRAGLIASQEVA